MVVKYSLGNIVDNVIITYGVRWGLHLSDDHFIISNHYVVHLKVINIIVYVNYN